MPIQPMPAQQPPVQSLTCEKCTGTDAPDESQTFLGRNSVLGMVLHAPSVLAMLMTGGCAVLSMGVSAGASVETTGKAKASAAAELRQIEALPASVIADFEDDGSISDSSLAALPDETRRDVEQAVSLYTAALAGAAIGSGAVTGVAGMVALVTFFLGVPAFIIGFLLNSSRKVWRCVSCGFVFDRA